MTMLRKLYPNTFDDLSSWQKFQLKATVYLNVILLIYVLYSILNRFFTTGLGLSSVPIVIVPFVTLGIILLIKVTGKYQEANITLQSLVLVLLFWTMFVSDGLYSSNIKWIPFIALWVSLLSGIKKGIIATLLLIGTFSILIIMGSSTYLVEVSEYHSFMRGHLVQLLLISLILQFLPQTDQRINWKYLPLFIIGLALHYTLPYFTHYYTPMALVVLLSIQLSFPIIRNLMFFCFIAWEFWLFRDLGRMTVSFAQENWSYIGSTYIVILAVLQFEVIQIKNLYFKK